MQQVFVVDDSKIQLHFIKKILQKAGYEVHTFTNGFELVNQFRKEPPHLIISDINMPKINGFDLFETLFNEKDTREVPFFFTSSMVDDSIRNRVRRLGAEGLISKPVSIPVLLKTISSSLN